MLNKNIVFPKEHNLVIVKLACYLFLTIFVWMGYISRRTAFSGNISSSVWEKANVFIYVSATKQVHVQWESWVWPLIGCQLERERCFCSSALELIISTTGRTWSGAHKVVQSQWRVWGYKPVYGQEMYTLPLPLPPFLPSFFPSFFPPSNSNFEDWFLQTDSCFSATGIQVFQILGGKVKLRSSMLLCLQR